MCIHEGDATCIGPRTLRLEIFTTVKSSDKFSQESPYISNMFSRESPKFQTNFHKETESPSPIISIRKTARSGDPNIVNLISSVSGYTKSQTI